MSDSETNDKPAPDPTPAPATPTETEAAAKPRRKRRKKKSGAGVRPAAAKPDGKKLSPVEALTEGLGLVASAYADLRARTGGRRLVEESDEVELTFRVPLKREGVAAAASKFAQSLREDLEKRVLQAGLLVPGRAWCFSSESFDSDYSRPEDPRQVLVGYGLEGRPRYADLVTLAIERKHEAVESLLAGKEGAVNFVEPGTSITEGVKPAFDPDTIPYRLVAQAVCGLFASSEEGRRVALTLQVLARDGEDGKLRLLAHPVSAVDLLDLPDPSLRRLVRSFQNNLIQIARQIDGKRAAGEEVDVTEAVLGPLRDLARSLAHDARTRDRKTNHARDRESERPTQLAFPEARSARDHHIYIDNEERTVVVVGKKGRIHVFSPDGRHVTTLVMPPKGVRDRVSQGRWRQAEPGERGSFREAIASQEKPE